MPIPTTCPECNADLSVPDKFAGKTVKCLECAAHVEVPGVVEAMQKDRSQREDEDEEPRHEKSLARTRENEERPRRRRKEKSGGSSTGIVVGLVIGVTALVGISFIFYLVVKDSDRRSDTSSSKTEQYTFPLFPPNVSDSRSTRPPLPGGWIEFKHPRGLYRVYVPCAPAAGTLTASGRVVDTEDIYEAWQIQGRGTQCHMRVSTLPPQELQKYRSGQLQASNVYAGKTHSTTRVTWSGLPATEVEVGEDTGWGDQEPPPTRPGPKQMQAPQYYMRWVVINDKLYTFAIANSKDKVTDAERKAFFDSVVFGK